MVRNDGGDIRSTSKAADYRIPQSPPPMFQNRWPILSRKTLPMTDVGLLISTSSNPSPGVNSKIVLSDSNASIPVAQNTGVYIDGKLREIKKRTAKNIYLDGKPFSAFNQNCQATTINFSKKYFFNYLIHSLLENRNGIFQLHQLVNAKRRDPRTCEHPNSTTPKKT